MKGWNECPECHGTGMAITWNDNGGRVYEHCDLEPDDLGLKDDHDQ